jgi:hypothetical protein
MTRLGLVCHTAGFYYTTGWRLEADLKSGSVPGSDTDTKESELIPPKN